MKIAKLLLIILMLFMAIIGWQGYNYFYKVLPHAQDLVIEVRPNQSFRTLGDRLYEAGALESVESFVIYGRLFGYDRKLKVGEYAVPAKISLHQLYQIIISGKSIGHKVVIPEGFNIYEVGLAIQEAKLGSAEKFIRLARDKKTVEELLGEPAESLEGYLFPDTYYFTKLDSHRAMLKLMVYRFKQHFRDVQIPSGWTRHQVVTLASIIEKETGAPFERRLISSVFHNRLKKKMRLQTDPTVIYSKLLQTGRLSKSITRRDLLNDIPYNTYRRSGLPPGPIANPGLEALKAAVNPENSNYLYFVSKNDGTHTFSVDYKGHKSAVEKFQLDPKARAGKSWRDLNKNKK